MSHKYSYSRTLTIVKHVDDGDEKHHHDMTQETFTAVEFDSFDEARKEVDKAIRDRRLELEKTKSPHDTIHG